MVNDQRRPVITRRSRAIPPQVRKEVWLLDNGRCAQCRSEQDLHFDHIFPFSRGGRSSFENVQLLCGSCNRSKSNRLGTKNRRTERRRLMQAFIMSMDPIYCVLVMFGIDGHFRPMQEVVQRIRNVAGNQLTAGLITSQKVTARLTKLVSLQVAESRRTPGSDVLRYRLSAAGRNIGQPSAAFTLKYMVDNNLWVKGDLNVQVVMKALYEGRTDFWQLRQLILKVGIAHRTLVNVLRYLHARGVVRLPDKLSSSGDHYAGQVSG